MSEMYLYVTKQVGSLGCYIAGVATSRLTHVTIVAHSGCL
jgi:hypothetical protein